MSESIAAPDIAAETVREAISRDSRFATLWQSSAIDTDIRDNPTIKALLDAVWKDSVQAMEELAETSPEDRLSISLLLVKIHTQVYIRRTLEGILQRGKAAEQSIRDEDEATRDA